MPKHTVVNAMVFPRVQTEAPLPAPDSQPNNDPESARETEGSDSIVHVSLRMHKLIDKAVQYSLTCAYIMLEGESGVGKTMLAKLIHAKGLRADKPFVVADCSSIPEYLFESELFGKKKESFAAADFAKPGKFRHANNGVLFLDNIACLTMTQQAKLLRALDTVRFSNVESWQSDTVNVQVICATTAVGIAAMVEAGTFRNDLCNRLNAGRLPVPPLRERREDIPVLSAFFLKEFALIEGQPPKQMDKEALDAVCSLDYPENVRGLKNLIYRLHMLSMDSIIRKSEVEALLGSTMFEKAAVPLNR
jgi:DNA-binding NtrC family response regulator